MSQRRTVILSHTHPMLTAYHSSYYAHELTKRNASDSIAKLGTSLFNARVDLNPHQLDAALFAFRSPLSRGAILADEVGLGKTIEAGLIISQLWAERKRRILVIVPATLRKQWSQELIDKFFLPSRVLDTREYNAARKVGDDPFQPGDAVIICSYHFVKAHAEEIVAVPWDLVVIDEAHRLRNVYKSGNRIAQSIKSAISGWPLLMLTATPLQNSLLELFGLVSFLDEHLFGDIEAFRARYMRGPIESRQLEELRERLRPLCQRTLRRQVTEYVRFTNRIPITQDFTPTPEEQELYDRVSAYLQRDELHALPSSQRMLMTLILRKLLASSTFAIAGTLASLAERLRGEENASEDEITGDFETFDEVSDEWADSGPNDAQDISTAVPAGPGLAQEIEELVSYGNLATSITTNAKGQALLVALKRGFGKLTELDAPSKVVIFTESRRTQAYLFDLLTDNGYAGKVLTINGTNTDDRAGTIYKVWIKQHQGEETVTGNKAVDLRAALVEEFRHRADILIATEAASEGVNLQFCSLVVNYDLPWNPQRIEQRIGRCHRYGQKHDVVVINFLNRANAADQRVFELLSEKFKLFNGVFGSSDEVLGTLESGVDFERRIAEIYQKCRSASEIDSAFAELQSDLEEQIAVRMSDTRTALLEHFDEEVAHRLKVSRDESAAFLDRLERCFWNLTKYEFREIATFDDETLQFAICDDVSDGPAVAPGWYQFVTPGRVLDGHHAYRFDSDLAQHAITRAKDRIVSAAHVRFDCSGHPTRISVVEQLVGKSGWLRLTRLTVSSLEEEDRLLFAAFDDAGQPLHQEVCEKLFLIEGAEIGPVAVPVEVETRLDAGTEARKAEALAEIAERNGRFFDEEIEKLERWADDLKHGLEMELKDLDSEIKATKKQAKLVGGLEEKLAVHRTIKDLESKRNRKRRELYDAQDEIEARKEALIEGVAARLQQSSEATHILTIAWSIR